MKNVLMLLLGFLLLSCDDGVEGKKTPPNFTDKEQVVTATKQQIILKATNNVKWFLPTTARVDGKLISCDTLSNTLKGNWFTISKVDNQTLVINVDSNTTKSERTLVLDLDALNAIRRISLRQK